MFTMILEDINRRLEILNKLENEEELSEDELKFMVFNCKEVHKEVNYTTKWHIGLFSVIELATNVYYGVNWVKALTEAEQDTFDDDPVKLKKETKPVEVFVRCED